MSDTATDLTTPSDAELISRVRGGDRPAYGELFDRHRDAATRLARQLVRGPDSDDLVSEAFTKVLQVLSAGGGPDVAFRAYLLTAVRRLHVDRTRSARRTQLSDEMERYDPAVPFEDTAVDGFERSVTARAFASLPERWQLVLWHVEVEGQRPGDVAPLLGLTPNSVSALAYRAREGLRQAYLQMHLADTAGERCRWTTEHLGAYVRGGLSRRDAGKVEDHLDDCRRCTGVYLELAEINFNLRALLAPLLLGTLASGYLTTTASTTGAGVLGMGLWDRLTAGVKGMGANAAVAGGATGAVATTALVAVLMIGGDEPERAQASPHVAPSSVPGTSPAASSPSSSPPPDRTPPPPPPPSEPLPPPPSPQVPLVGPLPATTSLPQPETGRASSQAPAPDRGDRDPAPPLPPPPSPTADRTSPPSPPPTTPTSTPALGISADVTERTPAQHVATFSPEGHESAGSEPGDLLLEVFGSNVDWLNVSEAEGWSCDLDLGADLTCEGSGQSGELSLGLLTVKGSEEQPSTFRAELTAQNLAKTASCTWTEGETACD